MGATSFQADETETNEVIAKWRSSAASMPT